MFDPCWGHLFLDPWNQHTFWGRKTKILQICNISLRGYGTKIRYPSPKNMLVDDIYTYINRSNRQKTEPWIWSKNTLVYQYIFFNRWLFFTCFCSLHGSMAPRIGWNSMGPRLSLWCSLKSSINVSDSSPQRSSEPNGPGWKQLVQIGWEHIETYGSVSKPCTPGEHQNSW